MRRYKNHFGSLVLALLTHLAAAVTVLMLGSRLVRLHTP